MKIIITEPTDKSNTKSIGCFFIENTVRKAGYNIQYVDFADLKNHTADVWLFSVHHVRDIFYLAKMPKLKGIKIGGGHVMNNPYPFLHFFDIICVGEGEEWILKMLQSLDNPLAVEGTLTMKNIDKPIVKQYINDISINEKYLNVSHSQGHSDAWYIETARGCKSKCAYCELGWTTPFRENNLGKVYNDIDCIGNSNNKKVNIFAPDDYSVGNYEKILDYILEKKLQTNFGSMRIDRFKGDDKQKKNFLFRLGVDGLSERIRKIINKENSNESITSLFKSLIENDFVMFKMFNIFSYSFETERDFFEFENVIEIIKTIAKKQGKTIFLRLKFTPLIPNPLTPLQYFTPDYNIAMRKKIDTFFINQKYQRSNVVIINDGILEPYSYYSQTFIARASFEQIKISDLMNMKRFNFLSEKLAKETNCEHNKVVTHISEDKRKKMFEIIKKRING